MPENQQVHQQFQKLFELYQATAAQLIRTVQECQQITANYQEVHSRKENQLQKNNALKQKLSQVLTNLETQNNNNLLATKRITELIEQQIVKNKKHKQIIQKNQMSWKLPYINYDIGELQVPQESNQQLKKFKEDFQQLKGELENQIMKKKIIIKLSRIDFEQNKKSQTSKSRINKQ